VEIGFKDFNPDFIVYNAGTDILTGDPLTGLNITEAGIVKRDEYIFGLAQQYEVPILMLLSGGYQTTNARVIANSIENLKAKSLIKFPGS
jgi:histone deacetylase 11